MKQAREDADFGEKETVINSIIGSLKTLKKYYPPKKRTDSFESSDIQSITNYFKGRKINEEATEALNYLKKLDVAVDQLSSEGIEYDVEEILNEAVDKMSVSSGGSRKRLPSFKQVIKSYDRAATKDKKAAAKKVKLEKKKKLTKLSKGKIDAAVGVKKKKTTDIIDNNVVEFNVRDLSKFYKSLEKGRATDVKESLANLLELARTEKLSGNAKKIIKDIIGKKNKAEVSDAEIKLAESEVMEQIELKREILSRRLKSAEDKTVWKQLKKHAADSILSPRSILNKLGEAGKKMAELIDISDLKTRTQNALDLNVVKSISELNQTELDQFADIREGKLTVDNMSENLTEALDAWNLLSSSIHTRAKSNDLNIGFLKGYFPRYLKEVFLSELNSAKSTKYALDLLMREGMSKSRAQQVWGDFKIDKVRDKKAGHLEISRESKLPDSFFERNPAIVIPKYIREANKRITDVRYLGKGNDKLLDLMKEMDLQGNTEQAIRAFQQYEGVLKDHKMGSISRMLSSWNTLKLSLSSILNLTEPVFVMTRAGVMPTIKNMIEAATPKGQVRAQSFADIKNTLSQIAEGGELRENWFLKMVQFTRTQNWADRVKVLSGADYAIRNTKALNKNPKNLVAKANLEKMGLDADKVLKEGLSYEDKAMAANKQLGDLMPINRLDLPIYWKTPVGREMAKFKSFAHKTSGFLWENVAKKAGKGNLKPLLILLVMGALFGEFSKDVRDWIRKGEIREMPDSFGEFVVRALENIVEVGGFGLIMDVINSVKYGRWFGYLPSILGPTMSDVEQILSWGGDAYGVLESIVDLKGSKEIKKKSAVMGEHIAKFATKRLVPFVGSRVAKKIDFDKKEKSTGGSQFPTMKMPKVKMPKIKMPKIKL